MKGENYVRQENDERKNRPTIETDCTMKYDDKGPVYSHFFHVLYQRERYNKNDGVDIGRQEKKPRWKKKGFPGGPVAKNKPCNSGDTSSVPGPGRSHMPRSNLAYAPQLLKPACPQAHAWQQEKPPQWEACTLQLVSSRSLQLEKAHAAVKT